MALAFLLLCRFFDPKPELFIDGYDQGASAGPTSGRMVVTNICQGVIYSNAVLRESCIDSTLNERRVCRSRAISSSSSAMSFWYSNSRPGVITVGPEPLSAVQTAH